MEEKHFIFFPMLHNMAARRSVENHGILILFFYYVHNHDSRPYHVTHHMILSVIFDDAIYITKALLITDKSFICYWLAY